MTADVQIMASLKDVPNRIGTSSLKVRRSIFQDLNYVASTKDIAEPVLKGLCKLPFLTLHKYQDSKSRSLVVIFIQKLLDHHQDATKYLSLQLIDYSQYFKDVNFSRNSSNSCLTCLSWSCLVIKNGLKHNHDQKELLKLILAQFVFISGALATGNKYLYKKVYIKLLNVWSINSAVDLYKSALCSAKDQPSYQAVVSVSQFMFYLSKNKQNSIINELMADLIELFLKSMISGKNIKVPNHALNNLQPLLCHINHDDFKKIVLPSLQKAMLRSAETVLPCIAAVVGSLSIDLSQYACEIGKTLATQLRSNNEECRSDSIKTCSLLGKQCSDPQSLMDLAKYLFAVLNGSEGKLTVITQRTGIIMGIGKLANNAVTGASSLQEISTFVAENFVAVLKQEVNEETLVCALNALSLWCEKLTSKVPKSLLEMFKNGISLKTSTSSVRNGYILCMISAFHGDSLENAVELVPILIKTVEKAFSQANLTSIVTEGLSASCLLLKLHRSEVQSDKQLSGFFSNVFDLQKSPFFTEKFWLQLSEEGLISLAVFVERLIIDHFNLLKGNKSCLSSAILFLLTRPSLRVRKQAKLFLHRIYNSLNGISLSRSIILQLPAFLKSFTVIYPSSPDFDASEYSDKSNLIQDNLIISALDIATLNVDTTNPELKSEVVQLIMDCLSTASHPAIVRANASMLAKLMQNLKIEPRQFIEDHAHDVFNYVIELPSPLIENCIECISFIAPSTMLPRFIEHVKSILGDNQMSQVTMNDYCIFKTPEGELFNRSCIEGLKDETQSMNMKRENKLYSYKEQMESIALQKEFNDRKKVKTTPQLTKKQQETMKAQLEKESSIRAKLQLLDQKLEKAILMLDSCLKGDKSAFGEYYSCIMPSITSLLSSPLCAEKLSALFVEFSKNVDESLDKFLALSIGHATLRLHKPLCELDPAWASEDIDSAITRIVSSVHNVVCKVQPTDEYGVALETESALLTAPAFSYCFPFFKQVLKMNMTSHGTNITNVLEIIDVHARLCTRPQNHMNPRLLPLLEIFKSLIATISESTGSMQLLASKATEDTAECANGELNHATATIEEIIVLLDSLLYMSPIVRESALKSLKHLIDVIKASEFDVEFFNCLTRRVFIARFDIVQDNRNLGDELWTSINLKLNKDLTDYLLMDCSHPVECIRQSGALAIASFVKVYPHLLDGILKSLLNIYHNNLDMPAPILDNFGRMVSEPPVDPWEPRSGVALSICKMVSSLTIKNVRELLSFFVPEGLGDRYDEVRRDMLSAAVTIIDIHGKDQVLELLPVFEEFLDKAPNTSNFDTVRQSVIILMGGLARHLERDDPKVKPIIYKLITALSTPSQQVQEAVSNCLPPLIPAVKDEAPTIVKKLLKQLFESNSYGERKGAAYGIAGLVKGLGILALKQLDIMNSLTDAIQSKKNHKYREGALFAFEMLSNMLGRLFEPYIVHVLPHLLLCFGDTSQYVREATDDTAKAVMSKLSAHGVKLVLPSLIAALEEDSWRTKVGSIELLGAMAFCAPKQLSSCLPNIVPKLIEVLSDSHIKVQKAGAQALKVIGSVIRNPEIQAIVSHLLEALQDPSKKTALCLGILLNTKFVHFIDAPSLALIMPVVQRAFQDRSTETRKMAAQIIGNMYSLTDQKDLGPYLPTITPGLQQSLLDPVPEVRCVSARALGAMVKGMGENCFENLMPWLMQTLTSEQSSVDRSGAAQGLSEVIGGLGVDKLHKLMPEIINTAERTDIVAHVKDGYMMLFIYMPVVFPKEFTQYIGQIINPILKALADENEYVRDTALRAGQRIVNMYADNAITLLLPQLEAGIFDENWRIRYSSVQLLGDLLYKISGVSGKMTTETASDDDNFGTEHSQLIIMKVLGHERRNRVLAGLYMGRSDTALMVRQAALHVWKIIVTKTPKTLREILPTLFSLLLGCLASTSYDKRQVAARTLGDLVRKLGERVLPEIIPILEKGLESDQADQRQGVCIGLSEIMTSTSREMVLTFVDSLVPTVRKALCDPLAEVRQAAAKTFDSLHSTVGSRALDDILPQLLEQLNDPELAEYSLDGLKNVMAIKSRVVLPYLVPQLTSDPVNTKALSFLSAVAGDALNKHLSKILPALMSALGSAIDTPNEAQEKEYCEKVVLSVQDDLGVRTVMDELMEATKSKDSGVRRAAVSLLFAFCSQTKANYSQYVSQLIKGFVYLFTDDDLKVLQLSCEALSAVIKTLDPSEQLQHVSTVRQAIRFVVGDAKDTPLPGFCLSKGITPILPIFREGILNGPPELKEQAATGLGEVIRITSTAALQPSVVHITGPLIRILGDRFSWSVKASVLDTLALLLAKVGAKLKPFLPQLQTTFLKALNDPNRSVRLKAASALSRLIVIHTRVDQLFTDLTNNVKSAEESAVRETMLQALRGIITPAGDKISDNVRKQVMQTVTNLMINQEDVTRASAAGCVGAMCLWLPADELTVVVEEHFLDDDTSLEWTQRHGKSIALIVALKEVSEKILSDSWTDRIVKVVISYMTSDRMPIVLSGIRAFGYLLKYMLLNGKNNLNQSSWNTFVKLMNHSSNDVKQLLTQTVNYLCKSSGKMLPNNMLKSIIPQLVNGTKEKNTMVKANSEYALVTLLKLRNSDNDLQACLCLLDSGAKDALSDVVNKVLRRVATQPEPKDEELDNTLLI